MSYVAQLLPDLKEARVLRTALDDLIHKPGSTESERDLAWGLLAKLTMDMREHQRREDGS